MDYKKVLFEQHKMAYDRAARPEISAKGFPTGYSYVYDHPHDISALVTLNEMIYEYEKLLALFGSRDPYVKDIISGRIAQLKKDLI